MLCFNFALRHEIVLQQWRYSFTPSLTPALVGDEWSASRPGRFNPRERAPGAHWIGGSVGEVYKSIAQQLCHVRILSYQRQKVKLSLCFF
jgi:hypothetical protein